MSQGKYAPITSSLLVRKGEAAPSPIESPARPVTWLSEVPRKKPDEVSEPRFVYAPEEQAMNSPPGASGKPENDKPRRIVLNLTAHEYETLGLVAVKKGSTRHDLAQAAIDAYFEWLVAEYGEMCNCIVGGARCRCECSQ